jgi:tetratricopeptide (TPR) repeat protein
VEAAVARAIADVHRDALDERAALLAHHWEEAGEALEAARWYARAGRWVGTRDVEAAYGHWEKVRRFAGAAVEDDERADLVIESCGQCLNLAIRVGRVGEDEAAALFAEGTALAERRGDLRGVALLHLYYAAVRGGFGDEEGRADLGRRATEIAERAGDVAIERAALVPWLLGSILLGRLAEGLALSERVLRLPATGAAHWAVDDHATVRYDRSVALGWMGELVESQREADLAVARAKTCDDPEDLCWTCCQLAFLAFIDGDGEAALSHALRAREYAERRGSLFSAGYVLQALGLANLLRGGWDDAVQAFDEAVLAHRRVVISLVAQSLSFLAEALLGAGNPERARLVADEAIALAQRIKVRPTECHARIARARIRLHDGPSARVDVEADLARAAALVEETGARLWTPFIHVARAELAAVLGHGGTRRRELAEAHRLFVEMGASIRAAAIARELGA